MWNTVRFFSPSTFRVFWWKRDGGDGDMKDIVKRTKAGCRGQKKRGGGYHWSKQMKGWEMVSLFQSVVPLWWGLVMQSAVSTVTGARKQQHRLAGGAAKEQFSIRLCTSVCQCLCVKVCVRYAVASKCTKMCAQNKRGCQKYRYSNCFNCKWWQMEGCTKVFLNIGMWVLL